MIMCQILSGVILILLIATLVIKEYRNRTISFFVPSIILALMSNAFLINYLSASETLTNKGTNDELNDIMPFLSLLTHLLEAVSISLFCLFLKKALYRGNKPGTRLISVLSFVCVPLTAAAAFLPVCEYGYPAVFILQTVIIILLVAFSRSERNVRAWFITAGAVYMLTCIICMIDPGTHLDSIGIMLMYLTVFIGYEVQLKNDMLRQELEFSQAKTALLMRQISPHFIFNSLQVIISLCDSDPEKVRPALTHFSGYLRGNLESITNNELIPFSKELEHTKEYLALEQYGDGRKFEVEYHLDAEDFLLPPLVLQPVVENAVQYGIGTRTHGGRIIIESIDTPFMTLIRVKDDGTGKSTITEQQKDRQSVGMKNVRSRLRALCGGDIIFESGKSGTTVTITIPRNENNTV